jgi:hypothetical protein
MLVVAQLHLAVLVALVVEAMVETQVLQAQQILVADVVIEAMEQLLEVQVL